MYFGAEIVSSYLSKTLGIHRSLNSYSSNGHQTTVRDPENSLLPFIFELDHDYTEATKSYLITIFKRLSLFNILFHS